MAVKSPFVAIVIPTIAREYVSTTLPKMVTNISASAKKLGVRPLFIIEDSSSLGLGREVVSAMRASGEQVQIVPAKGRGSGEAWDHGFMLGAKRGAACLIGYCDDFVAESKQFAAVAKPLLEGKADFVTGAWKEHGRNVLSFPKSQYLNEVWVSRLMNYANPHFDSKSFTRNPFLKNPSRFQAFVGIYGATPKADAQIADFMEKTFRNSSADVRAKIHQWGIDPVRVLAALALNLRTSNVVISARRFEHANPTNRGMERFVNSRLAQYNGAVDSIREFLVRTNQVHKLGEFNRMAGIISTRINNFKSSRAALVNKAGKRRVILARLKSMRASKRR